MAILRMENQDFSRNAVVQERAAKPLFEKFVVPSYSRSLSLVRGEGTYVWDETGKRYLDFGGGVAVNCLGHSHPRMRRALEEQGSKLIHCSNLYHSLPQGLLAERLVELTGPGKVFFCNSGAEANEALFKLARRFGSEQGRFEIITAQQSFHGRTLAGIAATGQEKVKTGFGPMMPGFVHVPFNDLSAFERAITPQTAAVLIEGIQGEGGIVPAQADFLLGLRRLTQQHGILLLWDGVQCGGWRTGSFHSYSRLLEGVAGAEDFAPDAIAMAKSLGGGVPIGATWIAAGYADLLSPGAHGSTYGGGPLMCAVSLAVLDEIKEQRLDENIRVQGQRLIEGLNKLVPGRPFAGTRGMGGLVGLVLNDDSALAASARLREAGLLTVPGGTRVVRFLPPLNVRVEEIDEALRIVEQNL